MKSKWFIFILVLLCCGCYATEYGSNVQPVVVTQIQIVEMTATPLSIAGFEGVSVFTGTAGTYQVRCSECQATVSSAVQCVAVAPKGFGYTLEVNVQPMLRVAHQDATYEGHAYTSEEPEGIWTIQNLVYPGGTIHAGELDFGIEWYVVEGQQYESCIADAIFTLFFREGGEVIRIG